MTANLKASPNINPQEQEAFILSESLNYLGTHQAVAGVIGINPEEVGSLSDLFGLLLGVIADNNTMVRRVTERVFSHNRDVLDQAIRDISETARRNFEPGGVATTLLCSRGIHATLAHRVAHQLWLEDDKNLALAIKSTLGGALSTDIHPATQIGAGFWLDHGLGVVIGETAVIETDVSMWHNVTLGSTLTDSGSTRHPRIKQGAVIGAGATLLGNIVIGKGASVAAGAIVLEDVPDGRVIAGSKATLKGDAKVSFLS